MFLLLCVYISLSISGIYIYNCKVIMCILNECYNINKIFMKVIMFSFC